MGVWDNSEEPPGPALFAARVQKATGAIVDISDDILHPSADISIHMPGRQTELDRVDTGYVELSLNNDAGTYTPGYASAPVSITQDMPLVIRETVGRRTFPLFDGVVNQADAVFNVGQPGDRVAVTAADWPGTQQDQGRKFIGTLAEYIRFNGPNDGLVAYWPLADPPGATQAEHIDTTQTALRVDRNPDTAVSVRPSYSTFGAQPGPRMDDGSYVQFDPTIVSSTELVRDRYANRSLSGISMAGQGAIAISHWYYPTNAGVTTCQTMVARDSGFSADMDIQYTATAWTAFVTTNTGSTSVTGSAPIFGGWQLLTIFLNIGTGAISFWVDRKEFTGSIPGGSTSTFSSILVDAGSPGASAAHLQIRLGSTSQITRNVHLAQLDAGTHPMTGGLRWQRTDERIATVSQYAGLTTSQLALDRGVAYMPRASLAGKTWTQVAQEAVDTEQGRLLWRDGALRFDNRVNTKYNV